MEPGAPWHVRLQSGGGGYEKFPFCDTGPADDGAHGIAFFSNAHKDHYLTSTSEGRVSVTGTNTDGMDRWFVCALDSTWVEIRFNGIGMYLGRNPAGYLEAVADTPNGNTLWHRSQFYGYKLHSC